MLKFTMKDNNPQYLFFTSLLSIVMPLSFMMMNQEHNMVFNFTTISQLVETFNLMMVGLSGWVSALMILISYKYIATSNDNKIYSSKGMTVFTTVVLAVTMASISFFSTNQMVLFYISFEASVFPTLMLIMKWGYQPERLQASYYFIMYTVVGSLPLLLFLLSYMSLTQSQYFTYYGFGLITMKSMVHLISLGGLLAFLAKAPLWGVHLWLPKAHVEAPVSGSMVLAGILLKLGGYGLIKLYLSTVMTNVLWVYMIMALGLWSTVVVSLVCLRQTDMKIMIAYSSVIHMGMMLLGLLSGSTVGFIGAMTMMIVHGFSSPGLFASANYNYENTSSRNLFMQKGFHTLQPFVALLWFILIATNMAAPPFLSLASELMIVTSMMKLGFWTAILTGTATFLSLTYNLFLFSAQQGKVNMNISQFHNMRSYTSLTLTMMSMPCMLSVMSTYLFMV